MSDPLTYISKPMRVLSHSKGTIVAFRGGSRAIKTNAGTHLDNMYFFDKNDNGALDVGDVVVTLAGKLGCYSGISKSLGFGLPRFCVRKVVAADVKRYGAKFRQETTRAKLFRQSMTSWAKTQSFVGIAVKMTMMMIFGANRAVFGALLNLPKVHPNRTKASKVFNLNAFHNGLMHALGLTDDGNKPNTQMSLYNTDYLFIDVK